MTSPALPWVAIRSIPQEGCDGWWIKAQPHAALRGFTHDIAWVNGGEENADTAALIVAAVNAHESLTARVEELERALRDVYRLELVIESAVRWSDPGNLHHVSAMLKSIRALLPKGGRGT